MGYSSDGTADFTHQKWGGGLFQGMSLGPGVYLGWPLGKTLWGLI